MGPKWSVALEIRLRRHNHSWIVRQYSRFSIFDTHLNVLKLSLQNFPRI